MNDYYVYVYIDPRNFEEFYYGKGRGSRKEAHLIDTSSSAKSARILDIRKAGVEPIIRVIAHDLTEHDALLVEATLLWKLGKFTTNAMAGHYSEKFRPHDSLHRELSGFDFRNRLYFYNIGEGPHRHWEDYRKFSIISAGQGDRWRDAINRFREGDIFAAYLKKKGFVGIGRIVSPARPIAEYPSLLAKRSFMKGEYVAKVKWLRHVSAEESKMKRRAGLYTSQLVRASLDNQPTTVSFLEDSFRIKFKELLDE